MCLVSRVNATECGRLASIHKHISEGSDDLFAEQIYTKLNIAIALHINQVEDCLQAILFEYFLNFCP